MRAVVMVNPIMVQHAMRMMVQAHEVNEGPVALRVGVVQLCGWDGGDGDGWVGVRFGVAGVGGDTAEGVEEAAEGEHDGLRG